MKGGENFERRGEKGQELEEDGREGRVESTTRPSSEPDSRFVHDVGVSIYSRLLNLCRLIRSLLVLSFPSLVPLDDGRVRSDANDQNATTRGQSGSEKKGSGTKGKEV